MDEGKPVYTGGRTIENLKPLETWWKVSGIILWVLLLVGALILNATLLIAFLKRPGLRTISNRFVMNLTVSNLLTCCVLNPLLILDTSIATSDVQICAVAEGATALVTTCSVFSVLLIAIDQYLAVIDPLRYRTRIDTLKCGLLILSIWIISIVFSLVAALNPGPKSLWLICKSDANYELRWMSNLNSSSIIANAQGEAGELTTFDNEGKEDHNSQKKCDGAEAGAGEEERVERVPKEGVKLIKDECIEEYAESTKNMYGFIYMSTYSLFAYLLPFVGVCWIYISICLAAQKNSERTRKTGSRPILSSASFHEDYYYYQPVRQETSSEDFQKITKIPSLSSIDEITETSSSHQFPKGFSGQAETDTATTSPVLFTVACQVHDQSSKDCNNTKDTTYQISSPVLHTQLFEVLQSDDIESVEMTKFIMTNVEKTNCDPIMDNNSLKIQNHESSQSRNGRIIFHLGSNNYKDRICEKYIIENAKPNDEVSSNDASTPIVTITPPGRTSSLQRISTIHKHSTSGYINSLKYKISNGSLFKYREETRAARVSAFVIVMGLICWTPYVIVLMLRNFSTNFNETFSHQTDVVALNFFILTAYISPLLFGYRSKHVKRELMKFFCFKREFSYKNNRSLMAKKVLKRKRHENPTNLHVETRCGLFSCINSKPKLSKDKLEFAQVPESALAVDTCRSSFSSGASTQISSTSTEECC